MPPKDFLEKFMTVFSYKPSVLDLDLAPQVTHLSGLQLNFAIVYFLKNSYVVGYTILLLGANFGFQIWMSFCPGILLAILYDYLKPSLI